MGARDIQMKYTIDNPKLIKYYSYPEEDNFTGVVKNEVGDIAYYENGKFHRIDGPAIIYANGDKEWHIYGKWHREDGPAIEYFNGKKSWYYNGKKYGKNNNFTVESWIKKWELEIFK